MTIFNTKNIPEDIQKAVYEYWCKNCTRKNVYGCDTCSITDELYIINSTLKNDSIKNEKKIYESHYCPTCNGHIPFVCRENNLPYCPYCGQRITTKWGGRKSEND